MNALTGISLWIALVTVVPGLVTVATVFSALEMAAPDLLVNYAESPEQISVWVWTALVVTIMVLTQALGILLEEVLVRSRLLGNTFVVETEGGTEENRSVYAEYNSLYILLAQIRADEDSQGHLQRSIAQYFLTNNTLISFAAGIIVTVVLALSPNGAGMTLKVVCYIGFLLFCLAVSYRVGIIRFREMAKSIWAAKRAREERQAPAAEAGSEPIG